MLPSRAFTPALALAFLAPFAALASDEGCTRGDGKVCPRACADGDAIACWLLGTMHRDGMGVRRDERRAAALYEQACAAGATVSCLYAAAVYATGRGVKKDESRATALLGSCGKKDSNGCGPACPSPAPSATPASPQSSSDYDRPPRPVKMLKPSYPQHAFDEKIEGTVDLQILYQCFGKGNQRLHRAIGSLSRPCRPGSCLPVAIFSGDQERRTRRDDRACTRDVPDRLGCGRVASQRSLWIGAEGGIRTPTPFRAHGPKPCASAVPPLPRRRDYGPACMLRACRTIFSRPWPTAAGS